MSGKIFCLLVTILFCGSSVTPNRLDNSTRAATYTNPILDFVAPDPAVLKHDGYYYLVLAISDTIEVFKSHILTDFRHAVRKTIYWAPPGLTRLWAPEMHFVHGKLYIYFTMQDGPNDSDHRMYVIKSENPNDPMSNWGAAKRVSPHENKYAIDGTVMQYGNGRLYFIWTGNPDEPPASMGLFIAPMDDPETVTTQRILLRRPKSAWEMHGFPVNEGPFIIFNEGRTFLVFSGSSTFTPYYCLGIMGIDELKDPLVPSNWWNDKDECVFYRNDAERVFGTGHASFVKSPDETETWMFYHAFNYVNDEGVNRYARVQKLDWNPDKAPRFPAAIGIGTPLPVPSGQV